MVFEGQTASSACLAHALARRNVGTRWTGRVRFGSVDPSGSFPRAVPVLLANEVTELRLKLLFSDEITLSLFSRLHHRCPSVSHRPRLLTPGPPRLRSPRGGRSTPTDSQHLEELEVGGGLGFQDHVPTLWLFLVFVLALSSSEVEQLTLWTRVQKNAST